MGREKWKDPRENAFNFQYIWLSIVATLLLAIGLLAKFFPELLASLGSEQSKQAHDYWFVFVGFGLIVGVLNALTAKTANK